MIATKDTSEYELRFSISYQLLKRVFPGNLFFIAKEWLLRNSKNSKLTESDFDQLYNKGKKVVTKGNEELQIREIHKNGLIVSCLEYEIKLDYSFHIQVLIVQNIEHSWVNCKLYSSPNAPAFEKTHTPNIFKLIFNAGKGGRNGVLPITNKPLPYELTSFEAESEKIFKNHLLPIITIKCNIDSEKRKLAYDLAQILFLEASTLLLTSNSLNENEEVVGIKYPDCDEEFVSGDLKNIVEEIRKNYHKQKDIVSFIPLADLHFIPQRLYLPDSNYFKIVVASLIERMSEDEKQQLTEAMESRYDENSDEFESKINELIIFPIHREILKSLSNFELKGIFKYLK